MQIPTRARVPIGCSSSWQDSGNARHPSSSRWQSCGFLSLPQLAEGCIRFSFSQVHDCYLPCPNIPLIVLLETSAFSVCFQGRSPIVECWRRSNEWNNTHSQASHHLPAVHEQRLPLKIFPARTLQAFMTACIGWIIIYSYAVDVPFGAYLTMHMFLDRPCLISALIAISFWSTWPASYQYVLQAVKLIHGFSSTSNAHHSRSARIKQINGHI